MTKADVRQATLLSIVAAGSAIGLLAACSPAREAAQSDPTSAQSKGSLTAGSSSTAPSPSSSAPRSSLSRPDLTTPAYFRAPCRDLMPPTQSLAELGLNVRDQSSATIIAADGTEQAEALAPSRQVATASCSTTGLGVYVFQFLTMQLAADDMAASLRSAPESDDPSSQTTDIAQIPGAKMVTNPGYGKGGVYWVVRPNVSVSVITNYDDSKTNAEAVRVQLITAAVHVDERLRR